MKKVKLALVGCGHRGIYVASVFANHPQCELTTLVDFMPSHLENAVNELKIPDVKTYGSYEDLLSDAPVDAIYFASDPLDHAELACAAMEKGIHTCTDVPAAVSLEQCEDLVKTVEKTGCKYQLMEQTRYWGFIDTWKGMIERGELGHICLAQGEYVHYEAAWDIWVDKDTGELYRTAEPPAGKNVAPTWRAKMLADPIYYLPHTLSPLLKALDDRVERVSCMGTRVGSYTEAVKYPWRDIEYALMHTAKDTVLMVGAGFSIPSVPRGDTHAHWYELRGNEGTVSSPRTMSEGYTFWQPGMTTPTIMHGVSSIPLGASAEEAKSGHGGADYKPVDTFIRAIIDDTTPAMDVYKTVEMTAPAIVAAESGRQGGALLDVPDYRKLYHK